MAAGTVLQGRRDDFNQLVRGWDRRLRVQQVSTWLPRILLPGLLIGILIALISRTRPWLLSGQILLVTVLLLALSIAVMLLVVWLRPRPGLVTARRLDVQLGLQERVSTALELIEGRIQADESLAVLQIDDAWTQARTVQISSAVPLIWRRRDWLTVLAAGLVLALLLVIPNPQETAIAQNVAQEASIDAAAEELREITENIASDTALEQADREELLQALETSQSVLAEPGVTPEEAFATLADAQSALQEKSDELNQQALAQQSALGAASEALRNATAGDQPPLDQAASQSLDQLSDEIPTMDAAAQQQAADALEQAADSLEATNPDTAQDLRDAADALRQGDTSAAQESLQQASSDLQNTQQSAQEQSASSQQLQESAQSAGEAADQVRQQSDPNNQQGQVPPGNEGEQSPSQQGQPGQQGEQQAQNGQSDQQSPSDSNQPGEEGGQPQSGQGQQGQSSGEPGDQPGQEGQPGEEGQPSDQNGAGGSQQGQGNPGEGLQGQQSGDAPSDAVGAGAGDGAGGAGSDQSLLTQQGAAGNEIQQDNNPDGEGEGQFDPVYAPQRIGGESDQSINLEPDGSDAPLQQGEFSQNPTGNSTVPYDQVFSDYSDAANQALESDYIPLGLRDVVRDYFSSLEPSQGGGTQR